VDSALVDTGAGYLTIPHKLHTSQLLKVYQEFGRRPYRVASAKEDPVLQRFAEVGFRFLTKNPDGTPAYWPDHFVLAKAYMQDADQRPGAKVLIGLDLLLENFITSLGRDRAFLKARGEA